MIGEPASSGVAFRTEVQADGKLLAVTIDLRDVADRRFVPSIVVRHGCHEATKYSFMSHPIKNTVDRIRAQRQVVKK